MFNLTNPIYIVEFRYDSGGCYHSDLSFLFVSLFHTSGEPNKPFSVRLSPLLSNFELFYYPLYLFRRDVALVKFGIDRHKSDMSPCFLPIDQPIT